MEDLGRGFKQINLEVAGVEAGKARFSGQDKPAPPVAHWRNNLTGLSQFQNLYFVAYLDAVYIYRPRFPEQKLGAKPDLVLRPPVSRPGLMGYVDVLHPHGINNLLIDELGDEEVLVISCDDGDVIAYHTRSVAGRIKDGTGATNAQSHDGEQVNPFFHENVGASAWGLAIHKAGRMLAISSNLTYIDVIAFGLCSTSRRSSSRRLSDRGIGDPHRASMSSSATRPSRGEEARVRLDGHGTNIPSIAFCNDDSDPEGQWLVSTDIDGVLLVWDIWSREVVASYRFGDEYLYRQPDHGAMERRRGWGVLCLGRGAFKVTKGILETFGSSRVNLKHVTDVSVSRREVKNSSSRFGDQTVPNVQAPASTGQSEDNSSGGDDYYQDNYDGLDDDDLSSDEEEELEHEDGGEDDEDEDEDGSQDQDEDEEEASDDEEDDEPLEPQQEANEYDDYEKDAEQQQERDEHHDGDDSDDLMYDAGEGAKDDDDAGGDSDDDDADYGIADYDDADYEDEEDEEEDAEDHHGADLHMQESVDEDPSDIVLEGYAEHSEPPTTTLGKATPMPRFSIVHTTEISVRLLSTPFTGPTAICREVLTQDLSPSARTLRRFERLNMVSQVPELGLVLVGSQTGRVAVFSLTRDPELRESTAFRLEFIVPFSFQEDEGLRPMRPLLGMAIGPIQGREKALDPHGRDETSTMRNRKQLWRKVEKRRRYRLMVTYADHTVLSYEIGRDRGNPFVVPAGQSLVV